MTYMIVSVNGTWLEHNALPKMRSEQPCTLVRAITAIGLLNDEVRKKYDSANLQPKTRIQSMIDAILALRGRAGYDAVKVCEAKYLRDLPATRSPNILPEGIMAKAIVAITETKNCTIPIMSGTCP